MFFDDRHSSFNTGEVVLIEDMQNDPRVQYPEDAEKESIVSMLSVPIKCRDAIIGIIRMYNSTPLILHEEDLDSITVLALHLGLVIENNGLRNFLDGVKIRCFRSPQKEGDILNLVHGHSNFMQGAPHNAYMIKTDEYAYGDLANRLEQEDFSLLDRRRLMNLRKLHPLIPETLNNILMHFSIGADVYYEFVDEIVEDLNRCLMAFY